MKKISFNERYGLQQAVLDGTKTMTRRIVPEGTIRMAQMEVGIHGGNLADRIKDHSLYLWRDEVAIAQRYKDCWDYYQQLWEAKNDPSDWHTPDAILGDQVNETPGWKNKMFVRADLMPHRIRITNIRVERLQDISEEDCLKEGIHEYFPYIDRNPNDRVRTFQYFKDGKIRHRMSPAPECFALLIDDLCGRGTWKRNPWVYVYKFELIK